MVVCECVLSDNSVVHIKNLQKLLQKGTSFPNASNVVEVLLKYIISDPRAITLDDYAIVDQYFLEHPKFMADFYDEIMMSATFHTDYYSS